MHGPGGTALADYWSYAGTGQAAGLADGQVADYSALMAASQPLIAGEVLDAYRIGRHHHLMDVGGGDGSFLLAAAERSSRAAADPVRPPRRCHPRCRRGSPPSGLGIPRGGRGWVISAADTHCPLAQTLSPSSASSTTMTTRTALALCCAPPAPPCRPAAPCCWQNRWPETPGAQASGDGYFGMYLLAMGQGRPRSARRADRHAARSRVRCRAPVADTDTFARSRVARECKWRLTASTVRIL